MNLTYSEVKLTIHNQASNCEDDISVNLSLGDNKLQALNENNILKDSNELQKISIQIARQIYEMALTDKSHNNSGLYPNESQNLKDVVDFLKDYNLDHLIELDYSNSDLMFNPLDEIFRLLNYTKHIKKFTFSQQKALSTSHYDIFIQRLSLFKELQQLNMLFTLNQGQIKEQSKYNLPNLQSLVLGSVTYDIQQCFIMKNCYSLLDLEVTFENVEEKDLDVFFSMIPKYNPELTDLKVEIKQQLKNLEMCLQHVDKIKKLKFLSLKISSNTLTKQELNLYNLPELKSFALVCKEPLNFLLSFEKISLEDVCLGNSGISSKWNKNNKNKLDIEISRFEYTFYCSKKQQIDYNLKEMEIIKTIVNKLIALKLDFSKCFLLTLEEFDKKYIMSLGEIFKESIQDQRVELVTKNCQFSTFSRLLLGWEFRHLKTFKTFYLNDLNYYSEVMNYKGEKEINLEDHEVKKLPYTLMGLRFSNLCHKKIVGVSSKFFHEELANVNKSKKNILLKDIFESFINLTLLRSYIEVEKFIPFLKSLGSDHLVYLNIPDYEEMNLDEANDLVNTYRCLQTLRVIVKNPHSFLKSKKRIYANRSIQMVIQSRCYLRDTISLRQLSTNKEHFYYLSFKTEINYKDNYDIMDTVNALLDAENIYFQLLCPHDGAVGYTLATNNFQNQIYSEKLKITMYQNLIEQFIPINPQFVYFDLNEE